MTPSRSPPIVDAGPRSHQHRHRSKRPPQKPVESHPDKDLEALERRVRQLERTLSVVCRESIGATVAGPCTHCEGSLLLVRDGVISCPSCAYRRSI